MEKLKVYPPEVLDSIKGIHNAFSAIEQTDRLSVERKIYRGWIYGKIRELRQDGFEEVVADILKNP